MRAIGAASSQVQHSFSFALQTRGSAASRPKPNMTGLGIGSPPSDASENPLAPNPVSSSPAGRELVARTEVFVRRLFEGNDASHDFSHVDRVRRLAVKLGESLISRSVYANLLTVELAALLHDVGDAKYADKHAAQLAELLPGADRDKGVPQQFLQRVGCPPDLANEVQAIVERVGFRKEIGTSSHADTYKSNELDCVRGGRRTSSSLLLVRIPDDDIFRADADKLDAIGAIGRYFLGISTS